MAAPDRSSAPGGVSSGNDSVDRQHGSRFDVGAEGEAVHRRYVVRGYVDGRGEVRCQHPAHRIRPGDLLDFECLRFRRDGGPGFFG